MCRPRSTHDLRRWYSEYPSRRVIPIVEENGTSEDSVSGKEESGDEKMVGDEVSPAVAHTEGSQRHHDRRLCSHGLKTLFVDTTWRLRS